MTTHHIFLSYSRKDNVPAAPGGEGWVTAFHRRLSAQHLIYAGRPLDVFFDRHAIASDEDWERRIGQGLRSSRLFLAFLSPNYVASPNCRKEWLEYLRLEHTLARGDEGIKQVFFVDVPGLHASAESGFAAGLADWLADMRRRNLHHSFDLRPWFAAGAEQLRELDAADRIAALRADPRADADRNIVGLADQIAAIDRAIALRLDRAVLAELAPGNLDRSYGDFVGRSRELRQLHTALIAEKVGVVGALHGVGGQGKTALAVQYAYAYAGHYAAGGRWLLPCEGKRHLAEALEPLPGMMGLPQPELPPGLTPSQQRAFLVKAIVELLRQRVAAGAAEIALRLAAAPGVHSPLADLPEPPRNILLILDNVDDPALFDAREAASLAAEPWLELVLTTRLDPQAFGGAAALATIPVDDLPPEDALALLRAARPFADAAEAEAAHEIVALLGGFTLGVELVGAFLRSRPEIGYGGYLARLKSEGLAGVDALGGDRATADRVRYEREKQIGAILADTLAELTDDQREILAFAALFPPDQIVVEWLRQAVSQRRPELAQDKVRPGYPDAFTDAMRGLAGRRLLPASSVTNRYRPELPMARMHRLVAQHLAASAGAHGAERGGVMLGLLERLGAGFEGAWPSAPRSVAWMVPPLQALAAYLHAVAAGAETARALSIMADAEERIGQFLRAGAMLKESLETRRHLHEASPGDARAARDLSISLAKMGDFFQKRGVSGDADRAQKAFQNSLDLRRRLHEATPGDAQAARDFAAALDAMGDFHLRRGAAGDVDRALEAFRHSLGLRRHMQAAGSGDAETARNLSVSLRKMANLHLRRGAEDDAGRARNAFLESLDIARRLQEASPGDARAARDLAVALTDMGDFHVRRGATGYLDRARDAYQEAIDIGQRLHEASPDDAEAARDVSVMLNKLGALHLWHGATEDAERARAPFQTSLDIARRLHEARPDDAAAERDFSNSLTRMGEFYVRRGAAGDADRARDAFQENLAIARRQHAANPGDGQAAHDLSVSLERMGDVHLRRGETGDADRAIEAFQASLDLRRRLHEASPHDGEAARDLCMSLMKRVKVSETLGDEPSARRHARECFTALDAMARSRREMDDWMRKVHAHLSSFFGDAASRPRD